MEKLLENETTNGIGSISKVGTFKGFKLLR